MDRKIKKTSEQPIWQTKTYPSPYLLLIAISMKNEVKSSKNI